MPVQIDTYALDVPHAYLVRRGATTTLEGPIRYGSGAPLIAPTQAGSTITITRPDGTVLVSGAAVTVTSSTATYALTLAASETLGDGWLVEWSLVISGITYILRQTMAAVDRLPIPVISEREIYEVEPELRMRVPQRQGSTGDGTGWQPQIDAAWHWIVRQLLESGCRLWLLREATGLHDALLYLVLQRCCQAVTVDPAGIWAQKARDYATQHRYAWSSMRLSYDSEQVGIRRSGAPVIDLRPVGRPSW